MSKLPTFRALLPRLILIIATLALIATATIVAKANPTGQFIGHNMVPVAIAWIGLMVVMQRYTYNIRWWLGWIGYVIPSCGLLVYLHLAFFYDWSQIASEAVTPALLFQYLPYYALFAGAIGAAIGWIIGKNVQAHWERYDR